LRPPLLDTPLPAVLRRFETRAKLYQLYYYLNQLNLFGSTDVRVTAERLASELIAEVRA
jgi:fructosamine-3-kinase